MRVLAARLADEPPPGAVDADYCSKNLQKATGHIYRAAFDALDGTVLSLRIKIKTIVDHYPLDVLNGVIPDYWEIKRRLNELSARVTDHRARKDIGQQVGVTLDRYVSDVDIIKKFYDRLLSYGPALDEFRAKLDAENRRASRSGLHVAVIAGVVGAIVGAIITFVLSAMA